MKLIRGSYAYIIGLLILLFDGFISLIAFFIALFSRGEGRNPLLSPFGSQLSKGVFTTVACAIFAVTISLFSVYALFNALKKNSLVKPIRVVCVWLFIYALITVLTTAFYTPEGEPLIMTALHYGKAVLPVILALCLLRLSFDDARLKIPCIVLCALCGVQAFFGYEFYRVFIMAPEATAEEVRGYIAMLLLVLTLLIFFVGLSFFIAGSTSETQKKKGDVISRDGAK